MSAVDRYRPPGRRISVDEGHVHLVEAGTGGPTVVFESGMGGNSLDWTRVMRGVPGEVHCLAYDRAGLGWSDPRPEPRSPARIVDELDAVLRATRAEPPYIFVAHSMGCRYVRLFAARQPEVVAGLVLVDGYHESWDDAVGPQALASFVNARIRFWRMVALLGRLGIVRALGPRLVPLLGPDYRDMPRGERARYVEILAEQRSLRVAGEELRHGGDSSDVLREMRFGDTPVIVIAHGVPFPDPTQELAWQESQAEMSARSNHGRLLRAARSAHAVMIAEPDVVIDAIVELLGKRPAA
jgi:pimeloyl-ACP methyl ester carboxylesterase